MILKNLWFCTVSKSRFNTIYFSKYWYCRWDKCISIDTLVIQSKGAFQHLLWVACQFFAESAKEGAYKKQKCLRPTSHIIHAWHEYHHSIARVLVSAVQLSGTQSALIKSEREWRSKVQGWPKVFSYLTYQSYYCQSFSEHRSIKRYLKRTHRVWARAALKVVQGWPEPRARITH